MFLLYRHGDGHKRLAVFNTIIEKKESRRIYTLKIGEVLIAHNLERFLEEISA